MSVYAPRSHIHLAQVSPDTGLGWVLRPAVRVGRPWVCPDTNQTLLVLAGAKRMARLLTVQPEE